MNRNFEVDYFRTAVQDGAKFEYNLEIKEVKSQTKCVSSYHDYSGVTQTYPINKSDNKFPAKLYRILSDPKLSHIITWLPHGRGWKVLNKEALEKEILPVYFRHTRYPNFIRQVNGWGFRRITYHCYYHEKFLRGMPHLCQQMKRLNKADMAQRKREGNIISPEFNKNCQCNPMPLDVSNDKLPETSCSFSLADLDVILSNKEDTAKRKMEGNIVSSPNKNPIEHLDFSKNDKLSDISCSFSLAYLDLIWDQEESF